MKYCVTYLTGHGLDAAESSYFTSFITSTSEPIIYTCLFLLLAAAVIYRGVTYGIERISVLLMPILFILIIGISIFALTISHEDGGVTRTGLDGLQVYLTPKTENLTAGNFLSLCLSALGQLFYSISIAMGIMVAYGSYFDDKSNLFGSVAQVAFFDTIVAFLAGIMIVIPFVVFMGEDAMQTSGPSLLFISVPKLFARMGTTGTVVGTAFFIMTFFAALTSAISLLEAVVACFMERFSFSRKKSTTL
ncbi:MAG: sodium-dependent transporter, partial [Desulfovibrionaceae bacterium]|nr:sodium-dependent transporter [Desulfovibrionaceae bacterium]